MEYLGKVKVKREKPNNISSSSSSLQCQMKCMEYLGKVKMKSETEKPNNINFSSSSLRSMEYLGKVVVFEMCRILRHFCRFLLNSSFSVDGFKLICPDLDHSCKLREEDNVLDPPTKIYVTRSIGALPGPNF